MITEEQIERIIERLINRIQQANTYFLMQMGAKINLLKNLTPSEAQKLIQILKYGGSYEEIVEKISEYSKLNIADIDEIFSSYAKKDQLFYEKFYEFRNIPFMPYEQNIALNRQTKALANIVKNEMYNFTRTNVLGYTIRDLDNKVQFLGLRETYNRVLDEALLNVGTGKETFDSAMSRIMQDIGGSGLKTIEYESGRSMRLDSAVRMHLKGRLRELHNENQKILGDEFGSDGVEISVHFNPAPDHQDAQGRQFSNEEYEKLQKDGVAKDTKGRVINLHKENKDGEEYNNFRPISEYNCYHYVFAIILGVSESEYDEKQLQKIIDDNNKGFEFEGKHYTMYEGTQLQRNIERAVREQKDIQIFAKAGNNMELVSKSQDKITKLMNKYKELSEASGLPMKNKRLKVNNYRRLATKK